MTNIIILRSTQKFTEKPEIRDLGKAGRLARMFERNPRPNIKPKRVQQAVNSAEFFAGHKKRTVKINITHKVCGGSKTPTVRAKEKQRLGFKEPRI